jgi:hypothetical protein
MDVSANRRSRDADVGEALVEEDEARQLGSRLLIDFGLRGETIRP